MPDAREAAERPIGREVEARPNLASRVLALNLRRHSADWQQRWRHPLKLAETFVDPEHRQGTCYLASNWIPLGRSKGYARSNGQYTAKHGQRKEMLVYPLRPDARERLADPHDQPGWGDKRVDVRRKTEDLRALMDLFDTVPDPRRASGRRHRLGVLLALLEDIGVRGLVVPLDAGHASRELERILREQHGIHEVLTIKGNCPETHELLQAVQWERERREIAVCDLHPLFLPFEHARQVFRVRRQTRSERSGPVTTADRYGITPLGPEQASAQELLQLVRGHWQVENANHYRRDKTFGEDASRIRTGRREFDTVPQAQMRYAMRPQEATELLLATG